MGKKIAFIFPGQGSQAVGMGAELHRDSAVAREVFEEVDDALGEALSQLMFSGDADELTMTANAQPALMAVSVAVFRSLQAEGLELGAGEGGGCFAGHSLGEYSAYAAAGSISLADTARLLRLRGQAMQAACPQGEGGEGAMAAILGAEIPQVQEFCDRAASKTGGICCIANDNASGQVVISGHAGAVDVAIEFAKEAGIKRAILLPVSAPFHCPLMESAADAMREALAEVQISMPILPVIANVSVGVADDVGMIRDLLVRQVTARVRWRETGLAFRGMGIDLVLECGVGKVLGGLMKRIDGELECMSVHSMEDIGGALERI